MRVKVPDHRIAEVKNYVATQCQASGCGEFVECGATYLVSHNDEDIVQLKLKFSDKEWMF